MSKIQDFELSADLLEAILWQYNNADHLATIIQNRQNFYDTNVVEFFNNWYTNVFNVDTANDFGLSVWAKILNVNFALPPEEVRNNNVFGFGDYYNNFFDSNFSPPEIEDRSLTTEQKRMIIKLTYQKYITLPSVPEINKIIRCVLGSGSYILDGMDMTQNYVILTEEVNKENLKLIEDFDLIPRPAGVGFQHRTVTSREFGFADYGNNFYESYFAS